MIVYLRTRVRKQPTIALYFEFQNELKFYYIEASSTIKAANTIALIIHAVWSVS